MLCSLFSEKSEEKVPLRGGENTGALKDKRVNAEGKPGSLTLYLDV